VKKVLGLGSILLLLQLLATPAQALVLDVQNGTLMGASGVEVGGSLYDVQFKDGSCYSLFNMCHSSLFAFHTRAEAISASQALLAQVFLDGLQGSFDSLPNLTHGCENTLPSRCAISTPYDTYHYSSSHQLYNVLAWNALSDDVVLVLPGAVFDRDTTSFPTDTFAVWSAEGTVPEPSSLASLGIGLAAMSAGRRRRKQAKVDRERLHG
jgi:hypothetical protein